MLIVPTGGNNLETICSKDFLGLATINMYYLSLLIAVVCIYVYMYQARWISLLSY